MHIQTICICKYFRFYFVFCFDFIEYYLNLQLWNTTMLSEDMIKTHLRKKD